MLQTTALSPNGMLLASTTNAAASPRISIRSTATGRLQTTLTAKSSSINTNADTNDNVNSNNKKLLFLSDTHVALLLNSSGSSSSLLTVWDITRGVVAYQLSSSSSSISKKKKKKKAANQENVVLFTDVATTTDTTANYCFYVASWNSESHKVVVLEYDTGSGKLQRKIKAGKANQNKILLECTGDNLVIASSSSSSSSSSNNDSMIRVLHKTTGAKVAKIKHSSSTEFAALAVSSDVGVTVDAALGNVAVFQLLSTGGGIMLPLDTALTVAATGSTRSCLQLCQVDNDDDSYCYWLVVGNQAVYKLQVVKSDNDTPSAACCKVISSTRIQFDDNDNESNDDDSCQLWLLNNDNNNSKNQLLATSTVTSNSNEGGGTKTVATLDDEKTLPETLKVSFRQEQQDTKNNDDEHSSNKKRKQQQDVVVLGPGQAGGEARGVSEVKQDDKSSNKRSKVMGDDTKEDGDEDNEDDDDGPTVAERLAQLQQALDEEDDDDDDDDDDEPKEEEDATTSNTKFIPKKATTESLTQLLQQALTSGDNSLLEMAFFVRDAAVVHTTVSNLSDDYLHQLLAALTWRLASKPTRAEHLCRVWLTAVLTCTNINNTTNVAALEEHLQPLQNLLQERLQNFSALLQLQGKLNRMVASNTT